MRRLRALAFFVSLAVASLVSAQDARLVRLVSVTQHHGDDDAVDVTRALRARLAALRACQGRRIGQGTAIAGRLEIRLTVGSGEVLTRAEITRRRAPADAVLDECLLRVMTAIPYGLAEPRVFDVALEISAPDRATAPATPADEAPALRAEIASARAEARCLTRSAARLERLLAEWEHAGPRRRERLMEPIAAARAASAMCGRSILDALGGALPTSGTFAPCVGCLGTQVAHVGE